MPSTPPADFAPTRWSVVLAAGHSSSAARRAMNELAIAYWFPLYAYLRREGNTPTDAEDLVQGFFARILEKDALAAVDRAKGKFRSFLLASLKNFAANEWDKSHAAKRGGGGVLALDALDAEARYAVEPMHDMTPDRVFERRWALTVLDLVLTRLRNDYAARDQQQLFAALERNLIADQAPHHAAIARQLNMTEAAVKVAAHRLRRRYRELLRDEIAQTVAGGDDPAQVDEELRQLLACL